jgi:hypothetical protein
MMNPGLRYSYTVLGIIWVWYTGIRYPATKHKHTNTRPDTYLEATSDMPTCLRSLRARRKPTTRQRTNDAVAATKSRDQERHYFYSRHLFSARGQETAAETDLASGFNWPFQTTLYLPNTRHPIKCKYREADLYTDIQSQNTLH